MIEKLPGVFLCIRKCRVRQEICGGKRDLYSAGLKQEKNKIFD